MGLNQGASPSLHKGEAPIVQTDTAIRKVNPKEKPYKVSDSQGLYLLVNPRGSKLWRVRYHINGVERKLAINTGGDITPSSGRTGRWDIGHRRERPFSCQF